MFQSDRKGRWKSLLKAVIDVLWVYAISLYCLTPSSLAAEALKRP